MHPPYPPITQLALFLTLLHYATAAISTITITGNAPAVPTSSSYTSDSDFKSSMLKAHNFYRGEHNASNLSWNDTSAEYASNWANACVFKHSVSIFLSTLSYLSRLKKQTKTLSEWTKVTNLTRLVQLARTSPRDTRMPRRPSMPGVLSARSTTSTSPGSRRQRATSRRSCGGIPSRWAVGDRIATARMARPGGTWCASTTRLGTSWVIIINTSWKM